MDYRLKVVRICRIMHWGFEQYRAQPQWLIDLIMPMMETENKVRDIIAKNEREKAQRNGRNNQT